MVDVQIYEQIHPKEHAPREYIGPNVGDEDAPEVSFLLLLPATIRGFGFHDQKWHA